MARPREEKHDFGVDSLQVNDILADLNARLKADPELRGHAAVKNILMQVQRYNAENQKMRELLPTIKAEMRKAVPCELYPDVRRDHREHPAQLPVHPGGGGQRREGAHGGLLPRADAARRSSPRCSPTRPGKWPAFRSTLAHAREEKYKTREALVRLYDGRQAALRLIEEEPKVYRRICQRARQSDIDSCSAVHGHGFSGRGWWRSWRRQGTGGDQAQLEGAASGPSMPTSLRRPSR